MFCAYAGQEVAGMLPSAQIECLEDVLCKDMHFDVYLERQHEQAKPFMSEQADEAARCGRYHLYRAAYKVLHAGDDMKQRARFPECVERFIRRQFPNPVCDPEKGCDYLSQCIERGHYRGFLTKAQSKSRVCELCDASGGQPAGAGSLWRDDF